jgi:hypothetical protein
VKARRKQVKASLVVVGILVGAAAGASAQDARGAQQQTDVEQARARQRVFMMEGVLERAVQIGVDSLRQRVRAVMPDDMLLLSGAPQVRGFRLEGYGVIFDVEVPALRRSMAWSLRTMNETAALLARDVARMRAMLDAIPIPDPRQRAELERTLLRVQQQVAPVPPLPGGPELAAAGGPAVAGVPTVAGAPTARAAAGPATVSAQSIGPGNTVTAPAPLPPAADASLVFDPSEAYTQEVKGALVDAMIENSAPLTIGADEWLTVAARDNVQVDRFTPGDPSEVMTIVLRAKGSDLAAYRAQKLTLEEMRQRVLVSEF